MFAKRQSRFKEEEPLVPHGLILQAMEETVPTALQETEVKEPDPPPRALQVVPPPSQVRGHKRPSLPTVGFEGKMGAERPVFWKKLGAPQLVKPAGFGDAPMIPLPSSHAVSTNQETKFQKLSSQKRSRFRYLAIQLNGFQQRLLAASRGVSRRLNLSARAVQHRTSVVGVGQREAGRLATVRSRVQNVRLWESSKKFIVETTRIVAAQTLNPLLKAQRGYQGVKAKVQTQWAAGGQARFEAKFPEVLVVMPDVRRVASRSAGPIAVTGSTSSSQLQLPPSLPRMQESHPQPPNSRLWASFVMAGLSALLVLGFVTTVHHYASRALPSRLQPSKSLSPPSPSAATATASVSHATSPQPSAVASRVSAKRKNPARVARPKPRHTDNDDYVARDTFVSYDQRQNSSH